MKLGITTNLLKTLPKFFINAVLAHLIYYKLQNYVILIKHYYITATNQFYNFPKSHNIVKSENQFYAFTYFCKFSKMILQHFVNMFL